MLDLESLLQPLSDDAPSGIDLEYDPVFMLLEQAGAGKAEQQFGETLIAAEPPDWRMVQEHALALAGRSRDLRVAVWLARCGARLNGFKAAVEGLQLVQGLLTRYWASVHPQLDASDGDDPTMRVSALAPLSASMALMADLRSAALTQARSGLTVRNVELGLSLGQAVAARGETVPSEAGVLDGLRAAGESDATFVASVRAALDAAVGISQTVDRHIASGSGLDLEPLLRLLKALDQAVRRACGVVDDAAASHALAEGAEGLNGASPGASSGRGAPGQIASRDDVLRTIDRLCEWIERHEPSNPAPLLLRRAQRLMSMSFVDIMRDLVPEALDKIEHLTGKDLRSG